MRADERDRLLHLLGADEPAGQVHRARRLDTPGEVVTGADHALAELRGQLLGRCRGQALLGRQHGARERGQVAVAGPPVGPHEDRGVDGRRPQRLGHAGGAAQVDEHAGAAVGHQAGGVRLLHEAGVHVAALHRGHQAAAAVTHHPDLRQREAGAGQQPAEPGLLRRAGGGQAHARSRQVAHRLDDLGLRRGDEQGHRRRRREAEDQPGRLGRRARPEAQHRLQRGGHEVGLALHERLGRAGLGAGRAHDDVEPLAREVALGLGDAQREILG